RHRPGSVRDAQAGERPRRHGYFRVPAGGGDRVSRAPAGGGAPKQTPELACLSGMRSDPMTRTAAPARRAPPLPPSLRHARILIVDDEPLIRQTLTEYLTQEGFAVTSCGDGEEAVARAAERPFDVALCDVQMPGLDGLELLERL